MGQVGLSLDSQLLDGVLSLVFNHREPLDPWCELQAVFPRDDGFACGADFSGGWEDGSLGDDALCAAHPASVVDCNALDPANDPACLSGEGECDFTALIACENARATFVDCDKLYLCTHDFCACDADGCNAAPSRDSLTLRRVGNELVGVFDNVVLKNERGLNVPAGNVRLRLAE